MTTSLPAATTRPAWVDRRAPVVVGIDGSAESVHALDWAIAHAGAGGGPLRLVHAWDWLYLYRWPSGADRQIEQQLEAHGRTVLDQARDHAAAAGITEVETVLEHGDGPTVLARAGADTGVIVLGSRHLSPVSRALLGSVSTGTVAVAGCPVVLVGSGQVPADPHGRVIVGLSGDRHDHDVLAFAFAFAERHQLPLRAILCFSPIPGDLSLPAAEPYERRAAESVEPWLAAYPQVDARVQARRARAVDELVGASTGEALLVVGRRTRRRPLHGVIGSVCSGVLHHAASPVAVVPVRD